MLKTSSFRKVFHSLSTEAFRDCSEITSVVVPEGVTHLGDAVFMNCINLNDIRLPESLKSIGECAFLHCVSLKQIVLPPEIKSLSRQLFHSGEQLTSRKSASASLKPAQREKAFAFPNMFFVSPKTLSLFAQV